MVSLTSVLKSDDPLERKKLKIKRMVNRISETAKVVEPKKRFGTSKRGKSISKSPEDSPFDEISLMVELINLWSKPQEQHPIHTDLPRMCGDILFF